MHTALRWVQSGPHAADYVAENYYADVAGARTASLLPVLIDSHDIFAFAHCLRIVEMRELLHMLLSV